MNNVLDDFESYLFLYRKFSISTYNAYKRDVQEFVNYLCDNNIDIQDLKSQDFINFFNKLKAKNISSACASRKVSSLKIFAQFLNEKHNIPDLFEGLELNFDFALYCNNQKILQVLNDFRNKTLTNNELRSYLIIYLLYVAKINVNQLINIRTYDICYETKKILINEKKKISIPMAGLDLLKKYIKILPVNSTYLFPVNFGNLIKPISKQAVWNIIKSFFANLETNKINYNLTGTNKIDIEPEVASVYQKMHPRA